MSYYVLQPVLAGLLVLLGVGGAALALRAFTQGEVRQGLRRTGWALVPLGALAVGAAGLVARIVGAVTRWGFQLVFSPVSWLGVVLLAIGAVLVVATRGEGRRAVAGRRTAQVADDPYGTALGAASPPATSGRRQRRPKAPAQGSPAEASRSSSRPPRKDAGSSGLLAELDEMGLLDEDDRR